MLALVQSSYTFAGLSFPTAFEPESITKKVIKIALPTLLAVGCLFHRENVTIFLIRSYRTFLGFAGPWPQVLLITTYLALKCILLLNQNLNYREILNPKQIFTQLKNTITNFAIGVSQMPPMLLLNVTIVLVSQLIFRSISMDQININYDKVSLFDMAVKYPFLEELFFREVIQGSMISAMKVINIAGARFGKAEIFSEKTINTSSRLTSAFTFGVLHSNQSFAQATSCAVTAYFYETWLYEKYGLAATFGLHSANNFVAGLFLKYCRGKS